MAEAETGSTRAGWRTPAGIGTIAAVLSVIVAVIALFVDPGGDDGATPSAASSPAQTYMFVYGTTMPGHLRYPDIEDFVAEATEASVPGRLYDSGAGYPAAKFSGQGTIHGYLLRLRPDRVTEAVTAFTQFEAGMFLHVQVTTADGVTATAYEWINSVDGMKQLPDGRWEADAEA
ncbi:gamma-glutamylcyclotransferase [Catellatospora bangladeshensis]|uniref:Gamma-glutamylcyclotransferase AIG2-like domain-containing protein n=1 Tax=Catellatospora bangladeshensis TaxID=310355 RepID=A0A8J3JBY1_9ACTN|nr:gamma-glutamylcyclotransferase [Catellatospora bangladeshensis]GIF81456.1 hypothetical protein Cba03nite_28050 [Catellatospora bangladeshensis]